MIQIFRIDLQNGNNWPLIRSFVCNKVIDRTELKTYKKRLKSVFEKRYKKELTVSCRYKPEESKYDELYERSKERSNK